MEKIVIIGAGPAGLLLAHYLLDRGNYRIEIYERHPDPQTVKQSNQRTFPIALQTRGMNSIRGIPGLEQALVKEGIWTEGAFIHRKQGKPRRIKRKTPVLIIDRQRLTMVLLEELLKSAPNDLVTIKFDCNCVGVNQTEQTVTLQPTQGENFMVSFDRLVGADGARSQVRKALASKEDLHFHQEFIPDVYKSLFVSRLSPDQNIELVGNMLHTWNIGQGIRVVMAPQPDNWLHGTLIFPPEQNPLKNLVTPEAILDYFAENLPHLRPMMTPEDAEALQQRPVSKIITVKCDRLNVGGKILLIGDAAHAVSPSIGQGCNSSLQDVMVFSQILDEYQDDWEKALPNFTLRRLPDVHALRDLSDYSFPRVPRMNLEFVFRITLGKKLRRWLPKLFPPLPMELIMEGEMPYSEVLQQTQGWINRVRQSI
jgi:kynurenine 3-monooxygenase